MPTMGAKEFVAFLEKVEERNGTPAALAEMQRHSTAVFNLLKMLNRDNKLDEYK